VEKEFTRSISNEEIAELEYGRRRNPDYHEEVDHLFRFLVPEGVRVCELGCGTGRLIAALKPSYGLGIDINRNMIEAARKIFSDRSELEFITGDVENFDY
jgi:ubiquinone/menaquinone biosynthesis C-methylase UbiE